MIRSYILNAFDHNVTSSFSCLSNLKILLLLDINFNKYISNCIN